MATCLGMPTTNVIEKPFATVRLRQRVTKGAGSRTKGPLMTYKAARHGTATMATHQWRRQAPARTGGSHVCRRYSTGTRCKRRRGSEGRRLILQISDPHS